MQERTEYHPLRALAGWSIVFAAVWSLAVPYVRGFMLETIDVWVRIRGITERFFENPYQQALFVLFGGAVIYLLFQILALAIDRRTLVRQRPPGAVGKFAGLLSGRNWQFWSREFVEARGERHLEHGSQYSELPLQVLLWAFPMFGFLGTVYGLSGAVGELSLISAAEGGLQTDKLQPVFSELDIAFDTTIQGIVSAVVLAVLMLPLDIGWARLRQIR